MSTVTQAPAKCLGLFSTQELGARLSLDLLVGAERQQRHGVGVVPRERHRPHPPRSGPGPPAPAAPQSRPPHRAPPPSQTTPPRSSQSTAADRLAVQTLQHRLGSATLNTACNMCSTCAKSAQSPGIVTQKYVVPSYVPDQQQAQPAWHQPRTTAQLSHASLQGSGMTQQGP